MKVFNWVHRRFLHVHSGITTLQDDKGIERNGKSKVDVEKHALLEHEGNAMADVLNDWKDGILAIGTLAIGPLEATINAKCELLDQQQVEDDYEVDLYRDNETSNYVHVDLDEDDDEDEDQEEDNYELESSPLMKVAFFSHELEKMDIDGEFACKDTGVDEDESKLGNYNHVFDVNDYEKECQVKRRVTLADLFLEESVKDTKKPSNFAVVVDDDDDNKGYLATGKNNLKIKPTSHAKIGLSKAKKLLKEELRPIKKINQFVKRMMKKKIHPDIVEAGKMNKDTRMEPSNAMGIPTHDLDAAYESASLLLLQGAAV